MSTERLLTRGGAFGVILGVLCCFTPLLPIVLGAAGMTGVLGVIYADAILLPFVALSFVAMAAGIWLKRKTR